MVMASMYLLKDLLAVSGWSVLKIDCVANSKLVACPQTLSATDFLAAPTS